MAENPALGAVTQEELERQQARAAAREQRTALNQANAVSFTEKPPDQPIAPLAVPETGFNRSQARAMRKQLNAGEAVRGQKKKALFFAEQITGQQELSGATGEPTVIGQIASTFGDIGRRAKTSFEGDDFVEMQNSYQKAFPQGDFLQVPDTDIILIRQNQEDPFRLFDPPPGMSEGGLNSTAEFFKDVADVIGGEGLETAVDIAATRGIGTAGKLLGRTFGANTAGELAQQGIQTFLKTQEDTAGEAATKALVVGSIGTAGAGAMTLGSRVVRGALRKGGGLVTGSPEGLAASKARGELISQGVTVDGIPLDRLVDVPLLTRMSTRVSAHVKSVKQRVLKVQQQMEGVARALVDEGARDGWMASAKTLSEGLDRSIRNTAIETGKFIRQHNKKTGEEIAGTVKAWHKSKQQLISDQYTVATSGSDPQIVLAQRGPGRTDAVGVDFVTGELPSSLPKEALDLLDDHGLMNKDVVETAFDMRRGDVVAGKPVQIDEVVGPKGEIIREASEEPTEIVAGEARGRLKTLLDKVVALGDSVDANGAIQAGETGGSTYKYIRSLISDFEEVAQFNPAIGPTATSTKARVMSAKLHQVLDNAKFPDTAAGRADAKAWKTAVGTSARHFEELRGVSWILDMARRRPAELASVLTRADSQTVDRISALARAVGARDMALVRGHFGLQHLDNAMRNGKSLNQLLDGMDQEALRMLTSKSGLKALRASADALDQVHLVDMPTAIKRKFEKRAFVQNALADSGKGGAAALKEFVEQSGGIDSAFGQGLNASILDELLEQSTKTVKGVKILSGPEIQANLLKFDQSGLGQFISSAQRGRLEQVSAVIKVLGADTDMAATFAAQSAVGQAARDPIGVLMTLTGLSGFAHTFLLSDVVTKAVLRAPAGVKPDSATLAAIGSALANWAQVQNHDRDLPPALKNYQQNQARRAKSRRADPELQRRAVEHARTQ